MFITCNNCKKLIYLDPIIILHGVFYSLLQKATNTTSGDWGARALLLLLRRSWGEILSASLYILSILIYILKAPIYRSFLFCFSGILKSPSGEIYCPCSSSSQQSIGYGELLSHPHLSTSCTLGFVYSLSIFFLRFHLAWYWLVITLVLSSTGVQSPSRLSFVAFWRISSWFARCLPSCDPFGEADADALMTMTTTLRPTIHRPPCALPSTCTTSCATARPSTAREGFELCSSEPMRLLYHLFPWLSKNDGCHFFAAQ